MHTINFSFLLKINVLNSNEIFPPISTDLKSIIKRLRWVDLDSDSDKNFIPLSLISLKRRSIVRQLRFINWDNDFDSDLIPSTPIWFENKSILNF